MGELSDQKFWLEHVKNAQFVKGQPAAMTVILVCHICLKCIFATPVRHQGLDLGFFWEGFPSRLL
jgi:hypothetical protein